VRIVVKNLACRRSGRLVFANVSFTLSDGEALVVTGRNGAGKSSLLALLAGRLRPDAGAIDADGISEDRLAERLHLVGHRDGLKSALTAEENLAFARDLLGDPALSPNDALDAVGLVHAAPLPVAYLSAGQRRRVALARLLVAHRPLWLLDEPTAALDAAAQETLLRLMAAHLSGGGLVVAATHAPLAIPGVKELALNPSPRLRGEGLAPGREASEAQRSGGEGALQEAPHPHAPPQPVGSADSASPRMAERGEEGTTRAFVALIARDVKLAARVGGSGALGLVFFLMLVTLVPFALGLDLNLLARIGPAILWLAAVLATLIGLDRLFQADEEDGSLDLMLASPLPLELVVLAKALAHWLTTGLPLALAAPLFGLLVALTPQAMLAMVATLLVGTPALTFVGAVGAALTASIRRGGLILAVLVAPLMIPTLIFGVSAANAATGGTVPFATPLLVLLALSLAAAVFGTIGSAAALRHAE
jgi:heme exporter protein B